MSFNQTYNKIKYNIDESKLAIEGGNAITGAYKISQQNVEATVSDIYHLIIKKIFPSLPSNVVFPLGSTGKKLPTSYSGDLDLGFDMTILRKHKSYINTTSEQVIYKVVNFITNTYGNFGTEIWINDIIPNIIHFGFPINNTAKLEDQNNKIVQVDIIFSDTPDMTKFYMSSPFEWESAFKGAHRNCLLNAIARYVHYKPLRHDDNTNLTTMWEVEEVELDGLNILTKTIVNPKTNQYLKYQDTDEDLSPAYAKLLKKETLTTDPEKIVKILIGDSFNTTQINSFEQLFDIVENNDQFKYKDGKQTILTFAARDILSRINRIKFPEVLRPYL